MDRFFQEVIRNIVGELEILFWWLHTFLQTWVQFGLWSMTGFSFIILLPLSAETALEAKNGKKEVLSFAKL